VIPTPLPVPLSERVEFASPDWLAAARAFIEPRVAAHAAQLRGLRFGVCEVYTDPPPHLGFGGDAAFHFRIDDGELVIGVGEIDDVDMKVRADYTKAGPAVTAVWEQDPARRARVLRELGHREGGDVFEIKGGLDPSSPAMAVLGGLHDHMARRTITSPDLDHRARRLGLEPRLAELHERGYTILENAFSPAFADELAEALTTLIDDGPAPHLTAAMLLAQGEPFEEAAVHPWVLTLAEQLVGRGCTLAQSLAFRKGPGIDTHQLHTDYPLIPEPYPDFCLNVTCVWALDDFTETSGPTVVVPGSASRNSLPAEGAEGDAVKIIMPKGSIALWHGATWHGAAVRDDPGNRLTLHNTYLRLFARTFDCYLDIDPVILERNAPALTTLCGLDDLFEKNAPSGTYRDGLRYARANYSASGF
jgi:hypothetical protein